MNRKVKILLLSLLGFSSVACSGSKSASKSEPQRDGSVTEEPRIKVMYGVRSPKPLQDADVENLELNAQPQTESAAGDKE